MGLAACLEESSESGSGHSNRLLGLRRFYGLVMWSVVVRGQNRDFHGKRRWRWRWLREERADCIVSRVLCLVSRFVLSFRKGKAKEALKGNKAIPKGKYRR